VALEVSVKVSISYLIYVTLIKGKAESRISQGVEIRVAVGKECNSKEVERREQVVDSE
jgi:hypothetical protein